MGEDNQPEATIFLSVAIKLNVEYRPRLTEELRSACEKRATDSKIGRSNGAYVILLAGMRILESAEQSKGTYENIPRDRSLPVQRRPRNSIAPN